MIHYRSLFDELVQVRTIFGPKGSGMTPLLQLSLVQSSYRSSDRLRFMS